MTGKAQLASDVLKNMTAEQIVQARKDGRLGELLAGHEPGAEPFVPPEGADQGARGKTYRSAAEWLQSLSPDQIVELRKAGKLDLIMGGEAGHP